MKTAGERGRAHFFSRADHSGTHHRECSLWREAGIKPALLGAADWYHESNTSMGQTLRQAHEDKHNSSAKSPASNNPSSSPAPANPCWPFLEKRHLFPFFHSSAFFLSAGHPDDAVQLWTVATNQAQTLPQLTQ